MATLYWLHMSPVLVGSTDGIDPDQPQSAMMIRCRPIRKPSIAVDHLDRRTSDGVILVAVSLACIWSNWVTGRHCTSHRRGRHKCSRAQGQELHFNSVRPRVVPGCLFNWPASPFRGVSEGVNRIAKLCTPDCLCTWRVEVV